jgi:hypothetical protein
MISTIVCPDYESKLCNKVLKIILKQKMIIIEHKKNLDYNVAIYDLLYKILKVNQRKTYQ